MSILSIGVLAASTVTCQPKATDLSQRAFYLPENPDYTIVQSALDSVRFTLGKTLRPDDQGGLMSISSFVDPQGNVMGWHDFGHLEGPGWAANAVGGAQEIDALSRFLGQAEGQEKALRILDSGRPNGLKTG